jgi:hypothetical protein
MNHCEWKQVNCVGAIPEFVRGVFARGLRSPHAGLVLMGLSMLEVTDISGPLTDICFARSGS